MSGMVRCGPQFARLARLAAAAAILSALGAAGARASYVTRLDPSIRSAGMAGASTAVAWGDANTWANPAHAAAQPGLRYEQTYTELLPSLTDGVYFENRQWTVAAAGVGVTFAGEPSDRTGGRVLDYGTSEGTDLYGNPTGTFESCERARSHGIAVRPLEMIDRLAAASGSPSDLRRLGDVAFGWARHEVYFLLGPGYDAETRSSDLGLIVRGPLWRRAARVEGEATLELELAYGLGIINTGDPQLRWPSGNPSPLGRQVRHGIATRAARGMSASQRERWGRSLGFLVEGLDPVLEVVVAFDHVGHSFEGFPNLGHSTNAAGIEAVVLGILSLRAGRYSDPDGEITDFTHGFGVARPLGRVAGIRYDFARFPVAEGAGDDLTRHGVSVFFDPLAYGRR